jgi:hypothetical protein
MTSSSAAEALLWPQRADRWRAPNDVFIGSLAASSRMGELGRQVGVSTLGLFVRGLAHMVKD